MSILLKFLVGLVLFYALLCFIAYIFQEKLIFVPSKLPKDYQFHFKHQFDEVYLTPSYDDKTAIHALHFIAENPRGVILYFHGNAGNLAGWGEVALDYVNMGYDVFMPDYRGYGKSEGKLSQTALFYDARLAYDHLLKKYAAKDITIFGRSLGTGIAAQLASEVPCRALILETPYFNLIDVGKSLIPFLPIGLLTKYPIRSDVYLQSVEVPIHIFHGIKDELVPYASGKKLYESLGDKNITLITIPEGTHNDLSMYEKYWQHMDYILKR